MKNESIHRNEINSAQVFLVPLREAVRMKKPPVVTIVFNRWFKWIVMFPEKSRLDCVQFYCSVSRATWTVYIKLRNAMLKFDAL
ncbi:hypothetical protein Pan153_48200 [Gimesia panareensis]|uniref:Uncharacterized protein n=1 Tax=Gimesia panareensis TaxID=2527978 RepID=A0A518FUY5_9PLAN|nr:hypothetical protein Pan153_48200 [Gimesia panareensis]